MGFVLRARRVSTRKAKYIQRLEADFDNLVDPKLR
jgi:hypothetical protein